MIRLVVLGGTGDAYLVCALVDAFRQFHGRDDVIVALHSKLAAVADLFPEVPYEVADDLVRHAEDNQAFQRTHNNALFGTDTFYAHPCFERTGTRVDQLTANPTASQADMYRMVLRLPIDAPLSLPRVPDAVEGDVVMIVDSTSWPNTQPTFWPKLHGALLAAGRGVDLNDRRWPLAELLARAAGAAWLIGPQCGVMSVATTGQFPCRKTFCTPSLDGNRRPEYWARETYPYGYVTKFAGEDYDVEEFKVEDDNHVDLVRTVLAGRNARGYYHDPRPVLTVDVPLSPGDFLDRLAVLEVKRARLRDPALEREWRRYSELRRQRPQLAAGDVDALYGRLLALHDETFALLDRMVPAALSGGLVDAADHVEAVRANRERVQLRRAIDAACRAPYTEVKSYHV